LSPLKEQKHCHQKRFLTSNYPRNAFAAGAPTWTPLFTALPRTPSWIRGREGKGKKGMERERGGKIKEGREGKGMDRKKKKGRGWKGRGREEREETRPN